MPPPPRPPADQRTPGSQFLETLRGMTEEQRDDAIFREVSRGNIPDFLRPENFYELAVYGTVNGQDVEIRVQVAIDYLAVGTNDDYVRVPVSPLLAQRIADQFGYILPSEKVVRELDSESRATRQDIAFLAAPDAAQLVIDPETHRQVFEKWNHKKYGAYEGRWMRSIEFIQQIDMLADEQILQRHLRGGIRAGQSKDMIYHPEAQRGSTVCIFHPRAQGVNYVSHPDTYWDYSHGARYLLNVEQDPNSPGRTRGAARVIYYNQDGSIQRTERMSIDEIYRHQSLYQLLSPQRMDVRRFYRRRATGKTTFRDLIPPDQRLAEVQPEQPRRALRV